MNEINYVINDILLDDDIAEKIAQARERTGKAEDEIINELLRLSVNQISKIKPKIRKNLNPYNGYRDKKLMDTYYTVYLDSEMYDFLRTQCFDNEININKLTAYYLNEGFNSKEQISYDEVIGSNEKTLILCTRQFERDAWQRVRVQAFDQKIKFNDLFRYYLYKGIHSEVKSFTI